MKQFMSGDVVMCSYRTIKVVQETATTEKVEIEKDIFFVSMNYTNVLEIYVGVLRLYYDQAAIHLL